MTLLGVLADLRARKVTISVVGDELHLDGSLGVIGADLIRAVAIHKPEILALFKAGRCSACAGTLHWISIYGHRVCLRCHPPASPDLVAFMVNTGTGRIGTPIVPDTLSETLSRLAGGPVRPSRVTVAGGSRRVEYALDSE